MKKAIGVLGLVSLFLMTSCSTKTVIDHDISKYDYYLINCNVKNKRFMPELETLSDYQSIDFTYKLIPEDWIETLTLQVTYDEEHYSQKVEEINNTYQFLSAPIQGSYEEYYIPAPEFTYEHYQIKVVDNPIFRYSRCFGMIGISDTKYEIAYLYYSQNYSIPIAYKEDCKTEEKRQEQMRKFIKKYFVFVE